MEKTYVILGPTSGMARALALELLAQGKSLILAGRNPEEIERIGTDATLRHGGDVRTLAFDAQDTDALADLPKRCQELNDGALPDGVILCYGIMPTQEESEQDPATLRRVLEINFVSAAVTLQAFASAFAERGSGSIAGISSVAGDRGRQSNYIYGASKAGLSAFLDGLRNRMTPHDVHVLTIKPGFVDTPMTHGLINPKSPLTAQPEQVARDIVRALERRQGTLYTLWMWRWVMLIIRSIPDSLFRRMKL